MGSILDLEFSPWLMLDPTPMAPSFSSAQLRPSGWMASTSSSDRLSMGWTLSRRSRALDPKVARPPRKLLSLTVASAKTIGDCLNKYFNYEIPLISSHVATIIVFFNLHYVFNWILILKNNLNKKGFGCKKKKKKKKKKVLGQKKKKKKKKKKS